MQREVRLAQRGEVARQKEIWKRCFGDDDRYIDFFYDHRYLEDQTVLLLQDGVISTMLTMIPVNIVTPDEKSFASTMLYAIATYPTMQNQGLATQ
ncbi:MAG: GNAT family N-acetyltransferase, partial [Firmicutes bacterium]|nr:GNAT family N-acetyltransferase [Bacillota bacterium]